MEDDTNFMWSWDQNYSWELALVQDTPLQGTTIVDYATQYCNNVHVSSWEPCISDIVSNDEAKLMAQKPVTPTTNGGSWTENEHRLFLLGLEKHSKGKWKRISVEYVKTRSPSQVASHAQKYFKRLRTPARKTKRRSSIFDITCVNVDEKLEVQMNGENGPLGSGSNNDVQIEDYWLRKMVDENLEMEINEANGILDNVYMNDQMEDYWLDLPTLESLPTL